MDQSVGKIGLGTGTLASIGRGTTAKMVDAIVGAARDLGISVIDTADSYTSGRCESLLGASLAGRRDDFSLITKAGYRHGNLPGPLQSLNPYLKRLHRMMGRSQCFSPAYLVKCLDRSLGRLKAERVEGFLLHDPPSELLDDPRLVAALEELRRTGKTKHIGVSTGRSEVVRRVAELPAFTMLECPMTLLVDPALHDVWNGMGAGAGRLEIVANNVFFSGRMPESGGLPGIARRLGVSLHELLMRFAAAHPRPGTILAGTRNPAHLGECVKWARNPLSQEDAAAVAEALAG